MSSQTYDNLDNNAALAWYNDQAAMQKAAQLYSDVTFRGRLKRFWARLRGQSYQLRALEGLASQGSIESHYAGAQVVDIECIQGSESRTEDFDREFNPVQSVTRDRWVRIAKAFMRGETLPPVDLIQVDDIYYVRDGHHRVSVARHLGQRYIDAEITAMQVRKMPL